MCSLGRNNQEKLPFLKPSLATPIEVDMVVEVENKLHLLEVKSTATVSSEHTIPLAKAACDLRAVVNTVCLLSQASDQFVFANGVRHVPAPLFLGA